MRELAYRGSQLRTMSNMPPASIERYGKGGYTKMGARDELAYKASRAADDDFTTPPKQKAASTGTAASDEDRRSLKDIRTHSKVITHTFKWSAAGHAGVPAEPQLWKISPEAFQTAFGKRSDGSFVVDYDVPLFMSKVQIVEYDKRTDAPLALAMHGIEGKSLAEEFKADESSATFAMIGPSGHQTKVGATVYELHDTPQRLAMHGTVNLDNEIDKIIMPPDEKFMLVPIESKSGKICSSEKFAKKLAPKNSEGELTGPGVVHVDPSYQKYWRVDSEEGMRTLHSYDKNVLQRRPFTDISKHSSQLVRWDRPSVALEPKSFGDLSDVAGPSRELERQQKDIQSVTVKVRYTILDQRDLGLMK